MKSYGFTQFLTLALLALVTFGFVTIPDVQAEQIVYFPLDTNPGWSTEGQWEFGVPLGGGNCSGDPTSGHTGSKVYGYNLAGNYTLNMPAYRLTTTPIDCSGYSNVTLSFWRWLGIPNSYYDHAMVEVSNDGSNWTIVWNYLESYIWDTTWVPCTYDISAVADNQPTVYIRWTMGPTSHFDVCSGWNIDDIGLSGTYDDLSVTPGKLHSIGYEGGPFEPSAKNYILSNTGPNSLDWTAAEVNDMPWLDVEPTSGTLSPGQSIVVSVSFNVNANSLDAGNYGTAVKFTNSTSGIEQIRPVSLTVRQIEPDGWASMNGGTTGGAGGTIVTVDNAADFKTYTEANEPYIIKVLGDVNLADVGGTVSIKSNKTIRGIGFNPTIIGSLLFVPDSNNIIIKGLNITNPGNYGDGDGMTVMWNITNLFITHCAVYDCTDGCIDITRGSDYVTVSWCKFYYTNPAASHRYVNLVGGDDSHTDDRGKLKITFHHNWWWTNCDQRMPRVRFGRVHVYNNYYNYHNWTVNSYCIAAAIESQVLVENNYFDTVAWPYFFWTEAPDEQMRVSGNILYNCQWWNYCEDSDVNCNFFDPNVFTPPYPYAIDDAADVPAIVTAGAGAPACYGDFKSLGTLNMEDLEYFLEKYWLATDSNLIGEADFYADGIVNFRELALLAENWGYAQPDTIIPSAPTGLSATAGEGVISLDWDDSKELDAAGYNVYRSETGGSGYVKLNVSLLTDSNYLDDTAAENIIYYYVATTVDTRANESLYSAEAAVMIVSADSITIQENESGFCSVDGFVDTTYTGYTGSGYCKVLSAAGNGIDWSISVPSNGTYTFKWRYSLDSGSRTPRLLVNDLEVVSSISFPATGSGSTWDVVSQEVSLTAGVNNIRLESTGSGVPNIDYIMITGDDPSPASCP